MANSEEKNVSTAETTGNGSEHSSSHGGHHSKHRRHRRPLRKRIQRWLDKKFGKHSTLVVNLFAIFVALLIIGAMIFIGMAANNRLPSAGEETETDPLTPSLSGEADEIKIELPYFDRDVVIISEAADVYLSADPHVSIDKVLDRYKNKGRLDIGVPVSLCFDFPVLPEEMAGQKVAVRLSETADFASSSLWEVDPRRAQIDIYNLKTATTYYYRIYFDTEQFVQGSFTTADTRRFMNVAGIVNVRDIGGIKTVDGKVIRQGLLYRGSELDGVIEADYLLKYEGLNTMLNVMCIRFEMDLRGKPNTATELNPLGSSVTHKYYDAPQYAGEHGIFTEDGKQKIRDIFRDLANPANYPMYMHCTYGLDRTGTVCYLLEALLGADETDLIRDYELSALYHGHASGDTLDPLHTTLETYDGNNLSEKVASYLLSTGVTAEEIASIRSIFLEP